MSSLLILRGEISDIMVLEKRNMRFSLDYETTLECIGLSREINRLTITNPSIDNLCVFSLLGTVLLLGTHGLVNNTEIAPLVYEKQGIYDSGKENDQSPCSLCFVLIACQVFP